MKRFLWLLAVAALAAAQGYDPPSPVQEGSVQEWDGPYRFFVAPGTYTVTADPILPPGSRRGGLPTGDVGKLIEVRGGEVQNARVYYDPVQGPPEFREVPGREFIYVINADATSPVIARFVSEDQARYYLGDEVVDQLKNATITLPDGTTVPVMSWQPAGKYPAQDACNYIACADVERWKAQEAAEAWREAVEVVAEVIETVIEVIETVIEAVVEWVEAVADAIADWLAS